MMTAKPVPYPNLVESMNALVDVHAAVHDTIKDHAANHVTAIEAKRKSLELKHAARKLLEK